MENCFSKKDFNPVTCKFSEKCKPGFIRNDKFRCVKKTNAPKTKKVSSLSNEELSPVEVVPKKVSSLSNEELSPVEVVPKKVSSLSNEELSPVEVAPKKTAQVFQPAPATKKRRETAQAMKKKLDEIKEKVLAKKARRSDLTKQFRAFKPKLLASNGLNEEYNEILKQFLINYPGDKPTSFVSSSSLSSSRNSPNSPNSPIPKTRKTRKTRKTAPTEDTKTRKTKKSVMTNINDEILSNLEEIINKIKTNKKKIVPIIEKNALDELRLKLMTPNTNIENKFKEAYELLPFWARPKEPYIYGYDINSNN